MITYLLGGYLTSPADTLVNTVNTVGVMGKGVAKEFRAIYPEMFDAYAARCASGDLVPGSLHLWRTPHKNVLNLPTKRHWRNPSRLEDIDAALRTFAAEWHRHGLTSVAFPQLGCGNGGLDWESQVRPLMERWLAPLPVRCFIHIPDGNPLRPAGKAGKEIAEWLRGNPVRLAWEPFREDLARLGLDLDEEDAFALWQALDDNGIIVPGVGPEGNDPDRLFAKLAGSSCLIPAKCIAVQSSQAYDATPVERRFLNVSADAVRLLPMRIPSGRRVPSVPARLEDGAPWPVPRANPMTPPSQLSLLM
jgi:O-acetyl-ADP-ribose deacetylase (regulator of RNase III)